MISTAGGLSHPPEIQSADEVACCSQCICLFNHNICPRGIEHWLSCEMEGEGGRGGKAA